MRKALELALEALTHIRPSALTSFYTIGDRDKAIIAIKEALAQPEQEPVVFLSEWSDWRNMVVQNLMRHGNIDKDFARRLAHYYQDMTPQRKPLTDEQIAEIGYKVYGMKSSTDRQYARAIEAAHGIKE